MIDFESLRAKKGAESGPPCRVITVRLSSELHEALKRLAQRERVSLNMICVASLEPLVAAETRLPEGTPPVSESTQPAVAVA